jgi:hypothetical protein
MAGFGFNYYQVKYFFLGETRCGEIEDVRITQKE